MFVRRDLPGDPVISHLEVPGGSPSAALQIPNFCGTVTRAQANHLATHMVTATLWPSSGTLLSSTVARSHLWL